jgi:ABC-2 type transport system permease protein
MSAVVATVPADSRWRDLRAMAAALRTSAGQAWAERGSLAVALLFYVVVVSALSGVWRAAATNGGGSIAGYSAIALTWYIATSEAAVMSVSQRLIEDTGRDVADGEVAIEMLRPTSVLGLRVAAELGRSLVRLTGIIPVGLVLAVVVAGAPPRPAALVLAVPSLLLAVTTNVTAQHAFAGTAFWIRHVGAAWFLYLKLVFVLGGMLLPLEVLPDGVAAVARLLPFQAMAYAPARLAAGHLEPWLLLGQVAWLAVAVLVARAVFRAGERRLQETGG